MPQIISLSFKKFIPKKVFYVLFVLLFICAFVGMFVFVPAKETPITAKEEIVYPNQGKSIYVHNDWGQVTETPKWLSYFAYSIILLLITLYIANRFSYPYFIISRLRLFKRRYGLPLKLEDFLNSTGVTEEWLKDNGLHYFTLGKNEIKKIIFVFNSGEERFRSDNILTRTWKYFDELFGPLDRFLSRKRL